MEYLKVWTSFREILEPLTDAEKGRLFVAMLEYAETDTEPQLSGNERYVWPSARQGIKRAADENERMRSMGLKGGRPRKTAETCENLQKPTETCENLQKPVETYGNPYKDKDKDNIYNTTTARAREGFMTDTEIDPLIVKVQQELNGLTDTHYQALDDYRRELGDELVAFAIDKAVGNGVRNWSYVESILRGWVTLHIRTIGEAKAESEKHKSQQQHVGKAVSAQQYQQREYRESEMKQTLGVDNIFAMSAEDFDKTYSKGAAG